MSEQDKQEVTPEEVKSPDSLTDESSTTDNADLISDLDGEESKPEAKEVITPEPKANKAKEQRDSQVSSWSERYYSGDVNLDEVPEWIQKEINKADISQSVDPVKTDANDDAKFEERMAKRDDSKLYSKLTEDLNDISMTKEQRDELKLEFKLNRKDKLPMGRSLSLAMRVVGVKRIEKATIKNPVTSGSGEKPKDGKSYAERRGNMTMDEKRKELSADLNY